METWHIRCRHCDRHYPYAATITVVHGAGHDWADTSAYCPACGQPQECSRTDYEMVTG